MWYQGLRVQVPSIAPAVGLARRSGNGNWPAVRGQMGHGMFERGYGILLPLGLILGVGVGLAAGEPSAGAVIGLGLGAGLALLLALVRR